MYMVMRIKILILILILVWWYVNLLYFLFI